jgi:predicted small secreted protein
MSLWSKRPHGLNFVRTPEFKEGSNFQQTDGGVIMIKRIVLLVFVVVSISAVTGCSTARGGGGIVEDSGYTVNTIPSNVIPPP